MTLSWVRKPLLAGLGLAATLCFAFMGCGGKEQETDEARVVTDPTATVPSSTAAGGSAGTAASPATTAATSTAPTAAVKAEGWGTLKGQIVFDGAPPATKDLVEKGKAAKDPEVCAKNDPIRSERLVVDDATKGVKNALVYIPKPSAINEEAKSAASSASLDFDQQKCTFIPHVLAVMTGAKVTLKNGDPLNHNINSRLKNNQFNALLAAGASQPRAIDAPERSPGEITCDIHPWMKGYWMILDSPYFAVTDAKGNFEIKNAPAGTQQVVVWHEAVGFVTPGSGTKINVKPNDTTTETFKVEAGKVKPD